MVIKRKKTEHSAHTHQQMKRTNQRTSEINKNKNKQHTINKTTTTTTTSTTTTTKTTRANIVIVAGVHEDYGLHERDRQGQTPKNCRRRDPSGFNMHRVTLSCPGMAFCVSNTNKQRTPTTNTTNNKQQTTNNNDITTNNCVSNNKQQTPTKDITKTKPQHTDKYQQTPTNTNNQH